jgi:hypothetical protein
VLKKRNKGNGPKILKKNFPLQAVAVGSELSQAVVTIPDPVQLALEAAGTLDPEFLGTPVLLEQRPGADPAENPVGLDPVSTDDLGISKQPNNSGPSFNAYSKPLPKTKAACNNGNAKKKENRVYNFM